MKNFDASSDGVFPLHCFACERKIPGGIWFARFPLGDRRVAFCRPRCVEIFLDHQREMTANPPGALTTVCETETRNAKELPTHGKHVFTGILNWTRDNRSSARG